MQKLEFGCVYEYSTKGQGSVSKQTKQHIGALKRGNTANLARYAARVAQLFSDGEFASFFGADVTLIPVPGSAPLVKGGLWVPHMVATALRDANLARDVAPALRRVHAVAKSAYSGANRPNVQTHYDSFAVDVLVPAPSKILLVDDVVTQGCTLLAGARRVLAAYPAAEVRAFALFRPNGDGEVDAMLQPCVGTIQPRGDRAMRRP